MICFALLLTDAAAHQGWPEHSLPSHPQHSLGEGCVTSELPLEGLIKKHFLGTGVSQTR